MLIKIFKTKKSLDFISQRPQDQTELAIKEAVQYASTLEDEDFENLENPLILAAIFPEDNGG
jgi:hypothetical protein